LFNNSTQNISLLALRLKGKRRIAKKEEKRGEEERKKVIPGMGGDRLDKLRRLHLAFCSTVSCISPTAFGERGRKGERKKKQGIKSDPRT